jgi:hypothetical protein
MCHPNQPSNSSNCQSCLKKSRRAVESVPTFREPTPRTLDVASLSRTELAALKVEDSFMFYSIPSARSGRLLGKDVEASVASSLANEPQEFLVMRQRRLSTECHPDEGLGDLFEDEEFMASLEKYTPASTSEAKHEWNGDDLIDFLYESLVKSKK